ncbi:MAG: lipoate protein ligase C-terminal domain-containing protein [Candidatus Micrarchaeaceae archaeon]
MYKVKKYKIKNGKLFEIRLDFSDKIDNIKILGDFFVYPDNGLELLEKSLIGCAIERSKIELQIKLCLEKNNIEIIGIDNISITNAILEMKE